MKRHLTIKFEADQFITTDELIGLIQAAGSAAGPAPEPCPTCNGEGCDRCHHTGRMRLAKVTVLPTTDGRATLDLWFGAPGTMQHIAETRRDSDLSDVTITDLLAALTDGGLIIDDRRQP